VLEPGEVIKDGEIARRLGVSRTPVREALQMLERDRAVEMRPGRLTRVTPIGPQDVARLYAPLGALMAVAAETATPRASQTDVIRMTRHNESLLEALESNDPIAARAADREFHAVLLSLAANPYLETAIEPLLLHARRLETLYFRDTKPGRESYEEHGQIVLAVSKGDAAGAAELSRHNFTRFWTPPPEIETPSPTEQNPDDRHPTYPAPRRS